MLDHTRNTDKSGIRFYKEIYDDIAPETAKMLDT